MNYVHIILFMSLWLFSGCKETSDEVLVREVKRIKKKNQLITEPVDWIPRASIPPEDTLNALMFTYSDELGLSTDTLYCMVVFENRKTREYILVAPWIDRSITIQKNNVLSDNIKVVSKNEINKGAE